MENFAENIRDKSPPVTNPEALAVALSNVGTMSPRLRKLYDDAAAQLRAQDAELLRLRIAIARAVPAMHSYASKNPKHEMNGALQDPCGVHAWLAEFGA